jgi:cation transport regulator ChaB
MPAMKKGKVNTADLPSTLKRSPRKAQRTYAKTLDSAERSYKGDEERAHRAAFASLKHSFEKVGDHWEPKKKRGPSDERAKERGRSSRGKTAGGVDVRGHTRDELVTRAKKLGITGYSRLNKQELAEKINTREQSRSRSSRRRSSSGSRTRAKSR